MISKSLSVRSLHNSAPIVRRGFSTGPITWEQAIDIIEKKRDLSLLVRSDDRESEYASYKECLRGKWRSIEDHILHTKFNFEKKKVIVPSDENSSMKINTQDVMISRNSFESGSGTELWAATPSLSEVTEVRKALRPNEFPYYFEDGIEHWILWKLFDRVTEHDIDAAKQQLKKLKRPNGEDIKMLHWINPPHLKTIPEIDHAHILVCEKKN